MQNRAWHKNQLSCQWLSSFSTSVPGTKINWHENQLQLNKKGRPAGRPSINYSLGSTLLAFKLASSAEQDE
jgi:hypothetical protein